jgi:hypothetical protein
MSDRLDLDSLAKQLSFKASSTKKPISNSSTSTSSNFTEITEPSEDLGSSEILETELINDPNVLTASIIDQDEDSQPTEKRPLLQILLIAGTMASTLGLGTIAMLWGGSDNTQQTKTPKPDESPATTQVGNGASDKDTEVADLKAKVAMGQQKEDAVRLKAAMEASSKSVPSPSPSPPAPTLTAPTTTPKPTTIASTYPNTAPNPVRTTPYPISYQQPQVAPVSPIPIVGSSRRSGVTLQAEVAKLAALKRSQVQTQAKLVALKNSVQTARANLSALTQQRSRTRKLAKRTEIARTQPSRVAQRKATPILPTIQPVRVAQRKAIAQMTPTIGQLPKPVRIASRKVMTATPTPAKASNWEQVATLGNYGGTADVRIEANKRAVRVASQKATAPTTTATNWEGTVAMGNYGGATPIPPQPDNPRRAIEVADSGNSNMSPVLRLPVGASLPAKLVTPFSTLVSSTTNQQATEKSSATVVLEQSIEVGSSWHLPIGTAIEFDFQVADNGMVKAVSKKVTYRDTEMMIPPGAFTITNKDSQPLMAEIREVNGDKLAGADTRSAIWGAAGEVGNVVVNSGTQSTVSTGIGTTISTTNNPSPNIVGAVLKGAFSPLAQAQIDRSKTLATDLQKQSKVGFLAPGTNLKVYVATAATFQVPIDSPNQTTLSNILPPTTQRVAVTTDRGIPFPPVPTSPGIAPQPTSPPTAAWTRIGVPAGSPPNMTKSGSQVEVPLQPPAPSKQQSEVIPPPPPSPSNTEVIAPPPPPATAPVEIPPPAPSPPTVRTGVVIPASTQPN